MNIHLRNFSNINYFVYICAQMQNIVWQIMKK